ncbi:9738_t:CDS:2 [Funneliformis geosporum]|nr:9738_t:CDS:2 [Funneliformis geosporum]
MPTPVSALLHAATMVVAGVFLSLRLSPFLEYSETSLVLLIWLGALTAFVASSIALCQNDLKRVIAYSTCSQLEPLVRAPINGAGTIRGIGQSAGNQRNLKNPIFYSSPSGATHSGQCDQPKAKPTRKRLTRAQKEAIRGKGARLHVDLKDKEFASLIWELFNAIGIVGAQPYLNSWADGRQTYAFATFTHPYFTDLQSQWYTIVDGKPVKVLPENIADL